MAIDILITTLKQILEERDHLQNDINQIRSIYQRRSKNEDVKIVLPEEDEFAIHVYGETDLEIDEVGDLSDDFKVDLLNPNASQDDEIIILDDLEREPLIHIVNDDDNKDITDDNSDLVISVFQDEVNQEISKKLGEFNEEWADKNLPILKNQISQNTETLKTLKDKIDSLEEDYISQRRELTRQRNLVLTRFDQQISDEDESYQQKKQDFQNIADQQRRRAIQIRQADRLQLANDARKTKIISGVGLSLFGTILIGTILAIAFAFYSSMTNLAFGLAVFLVVFLILSVMFFGGYYFWRHRKGDSKIQIDVIDDENSIDALDQMHEAQAKRLQQQRQQANQGYLSDLSSSENQYKVEYSELSQRVNSIYQKLTTNLIPALSELLDDWLLYIAKELNNLHPTWDDLLLRDFRDIQNDSYVTMAGLRIGSLIYNRPVATIPAVINLLGDRKHLFIQVKNVDQRSSYLRCELVRLLVGMPIGLTRVLLIDSVDLGRALTPVHKKLNKDLGGDKVFSTEEEITKEITIIRERISHFNHDILGNGYNNIDEYNQQNPEITVPYYFVAISNFPTGFDNQAFKVLKDIIRTGPVAGVYVLATLSDDPVQNNDFKLNDYIANNYLLEVDDEGNISWNSEELKGYRVQSDPLVTDDYLARMVSMVTNEYEKKPTLINYDRIARDMPVSWSLSTSQGMQAPVGLSIGGKVFNFPFDDQYVHALVGGRTRMGKTVFLKDLVCGLGEIHSPEELELYLLDFKGIDLNFFGIYRLPHARVVAVDCDVEIGLSVINKLLQVINERRRIFNDANVSNIGDYNEKGFRLPRILFIIDEIQMMTQYADAALTRKVENGIEQLLRQGGAYGIHLLLGTQSPTGVLTNQMLQQIAVRLCFQADETVSRQVLGGVDEAASRLEKKGEAVYNVSNGDPNKNVFLRTAFINNEHIIEIVETLAKRAEAINFIPKEEMMYFDGRHRDRLSENQTIHEMLDLLQEPKRELKFSIPVGNALDIKSDTTISFRRSKYSNLLIVGGDHSDELHGLVRNILLALYIVGGCHQVRYYLIDLCHHDQPFSGINDSFSKMPVRPQYAKNPSLATDLIDEVYTSFTERLVAEKSGRPIDEVSIFLIIYGMENFASMRGGDQWDKPDIRKRFEEILSDGSRLGVHTIVATQTLGGRLIIDPKEFGLRACFQISDNDSQALFDSDLAAKMRPDRVAYRQMDWEIGRVEKFKPYLPPSADEIVQIANTIGKRQ